MMDIEKYLQNFNKITNEQSLDVMKYFIDYYNNFQSKMRFIHIAGTNGKGSCTKILSNILKEDGYKVGKFLSPHLVKFNERISINDVDISDKDMESLILELIPVIETYNNTNIKKVTLFELETIIALIYFYRNNVDIVVLETGLGGLYDCTNIITNPMVCIITSVGLDHMHILGNTLEEIAYQKTGIIKQNSDTIIFNSSEQVNKVFIDECNKKGSTIHIISKNDIINYSYDYEMQYFNYKNINNLNTNLKGKIQIQNAALCIEAILTLSRKGFKVSDNSIRRGLNNVRNKGRMETINTSPLIIFDGAHNEPAAHELNKMIDMYYKDYNKTFIISILKIKKHEELLKLFAKNVNSKFIVTSGNDKERYASGQTLYNTLLKYIDKNNILIKDLNEAVNIALNNDKKTVTFIVGSFYTYGTVINEINNTNKI